MLPHVVRRVSVGFLLARLVLIDGGRNHHAAPGVHKVVRHEPWDLADERDKALLDPPRDLLRLRDALVPPYCCVHSIAPSAAPAAPGRVPTCHGVVCRQAPSSPRSTVA